MTINRGPTGVFLALLAGVAGAAHADDYWTYRYGDIEVVSTMGRERAVSLARDLARFDGVLNRILHSPEIHVLTRIYELPPSQVKALLGDENRTIFHYTGYEALVVTGPPLHNVAHNWGPNFGYAGSFMISGRLVRVPYWFRVGVPALFARTEFDGPRAKTGGVDPGYMNRLMRSTLIPSRVMLQLQGSDPQLNDPAFTAVFEAQSWFLSKEVLVENRLRGEFARYLGLLRQGKSEAEAFAQSFSISYEDLDKVLQQDLTRPAHAFLVDAPRETAAESAAERLTSGASLAQFAALQLQWRHRDEALKLAADAARMDPASEVAQSVLARGNLEAGNGAESLAAANRLAGLEMRSIEARTYGAEVLAGIARAVGARQTSVGVEAGELGRRAIEGYEEVIRTNPEYLRAWGGLAGVLADRGDRAAAQAFISRAQPVLEQHPYSSSLARALAILAARTGQRSNAFLFAQYWRNNAVSQEEQDKAIAFAAEIPTKVQQSDGPTP
jgi:hypothetical protein